VETDKPLQKSKYNYECFDQTNAERMKQYLSGDILPKQLRDLYRGLSNFSIEKVIQTTVELTNKTAVVLGVVAGVVLGAVDLSLSCMFAWGALMIGLGTHVHPLNRALAAELKSGVLETDTLTD